MCKWYKKHDKKSVSEESIPEPTCYVSPKANSFSSLNVSSIRASLHVNPIPEGELLPDVEWDAQPAFNRAASDGCLSISKKAMASLSMTQWKEIEELLASIAQAENDPNVQSILTRIRELIPKSETTTYSRSSTCIPRTSMICAPSNHISLMSAKSLERMNCIQDVFNATFFPSAFRDTCDSSILGSTITESKVNYVFDKHGIRHKPNSEEESALEGLKERLMKNPVIAVFDSEDWGKWGWHAFDLEGVCEDPMGLTAVKVFSESQRYNFEAIDIGMEDIASFFCMVGSNYKSNPFHNELSGVDVFVTTKYLVDNIKTLDKLPSKVCFAVLVAAACHGVCHPGCTNAYLVNSGDDLAITYNDNSILENYHIAQTFRILKYFPQFFKNWNCSEKRQFRQTVVDCILGTDMSQHVINWTSVKETYNQTTAEGRLAILPSLVYSATISMVAKPINQMLDLVDRSMKEYFAQGELEKKNNLPISPLCNKNAISVPQAQAGFIEYMATPWFKAMSEKVCQEAFVEPVKHLEINLIYWKKKLLVVSNEDTFSSEVSENKEKL